MAGKRHARAAAAKAARVTPNSEPEYDNFSSNEVVPMSESPTPVIPLHLQPVSELRNKRAHWSSSDDEYGDSEGSSAQGCRRKKQASSVINLFDGSDHRSAGDNNEAPRLADERNQHPQASNNSVGWPGTPSGLFSGDESPPLDQSPLVQSEIGAVASPSRQLDDDVRHVLDGLRNNNQDENDDEEDDDVVHQQADHERTPPRNAWTPPQSLSSGIIQIFNFDPENILPNAPNELVPVVTLDDLSAEAISKCVQILTAERDRLRAEHSNMKATVARLVHGVFHPEATLEWQVAVRLASIERIVRFSELSHAVAETKRAALINHLYSRAAPSPDVTHDKADRDQAPPIRNVSNTVNRLAEEAEAAKQDHEAMATREKDAARQFGAANEALAEADRRLEEFTANTKARLESLETQIVYVGRRLVAVQAFST